MCQGNVSVVAGSPRLRPLAARAGYVKTQVPEDLENVAKIPLARSRQRRDDYLRHKRSRAQAVV